MSDLNVRNEKLKQWLDEGAPEEALEQLGLLVKSFDAEASEEDIAFKDVEEEGANAQENSDASENEESSSDEVDTSDKDVSEDVSEDTSEDTETPDSSDASENSGDPEGTEKSASVASFETILVKTVDAALETYHQTVVQPLLDKINELEINVLNTTKSKSASSLFTMDELLPAAAVTALVKEKYGVSDSIDGDAVSEEEIETASKDLESEAKSVSNDSNLLSGLL